MTTELRINRTSEIGTFGFQTFNVVLDATLKIFSTFAAKNLPKYRSLKSWERQKILDLNPKEAAISYQNCLTFATIQNIMQLGVMNRIVDYSDSKPADFDC